jgi:myo-inositol-1(or 4)-monophosphatase
VVGVLHNNVKQCICFSSQQKGGPLYSDFLTFAIFLAKQTGAMLKEAQEHMAIKIEEKRANDLVTQFDRQADDMITASIRKAYPDHQILAEESGAHFKHSDYCWIIDPIDGTTNFAHHIPMFAISIALQHQNKTIMGVVYNPMNGELFTAQKDQGAFLNGQRLQISGHSTIEGALLATGFPCKDPEDVKPYIQTFEQMLRASQGIRRIGAASLDLAYIAAGRIDGFWEFRLQPWDIAAAALMIEEAGGILCDCFGGSDYPNKGVVAGSPTLCSALTAITQIGNNP